MSSRFRPFVDESSDPPSPMSLLMLYVELTTPSLLDHLERVQEFYDELPYLDVHIAVDIIAARTAFMMRN